MIVVSSYLKAAVKVIEKFSNQNLSRFAFMSAFKIDISGIPCYISRCGYTGEDGFEISVAHEKVVELTELLLSENTVKMAGLGARDSLRLEAGLCLYGHDLNDDITPVEGGLTWTIGILPALLTIIKVKEEEKMADSWVLIIFYLKLDPRMQ